MIPGFFLLIISIVSSEFINSFDFQQSSPSNSNDFKIIQNADFPAKYDYSCENSKAEWGCVFSLNDINEAKRKCKNDPKCKAFVVMPHLKKPGWNIVIFKNDINNTIQYVDKTYLKVTMNT